MLLTDGLGKTIFLMVTSLLYTWHAFGTYTCITCRLLNSDVSTRRPDLSGLLTIPAPPQDVFSSRNVVGNDQFVLNGVSVVLVSGVKVGQRVRHERLVRAHIGGAAREVLRVALGALARAGTVCRVRGRSATGPSTPKAAGPAS